MKDAAYIACWFGTLYRRSQQYMTEVCGPLGIGFQEYVFMQLLYRNEGVTQEEMAGLLCVDKAAVTRTIQLLEGKGWLRREQGLTDKRKKRLYLTRDGWAQQSYLEGAVDAWISFLAEGMDGAQVESFIHCLGNLAEKSGGIASVLIGFRNGEGAAKTRETEGGSCK